MVGPDWGYAVEVWDVGVVDRRFSLVTRVPTHVVEGQPEALCWHLEAMQGKMVEAGSAISDLRWYAWRVQPTREQVIANGPGV